MVELVSSKLLENSIEQYKVEERSIIAKRIISANKRIKQLVSACKTDKISLPENVERLKMEIFEFTHDINFKKCKSMGEILNLTLDFVKRNYENVSMRQIIDKKINL